ARIGDDRPADGGIRARSIALRADGARARGRGVAGPDLVAGAAGPRRLAADRVCYGDGRRGRLRGLGAAGGRHAAFRELQVSDGDALEGERIVDREYALAAGLEVDEDERALIARPGERRAHVGRRGAHRARNHPSDAVELPLVAIVEVEVLRP